MTPEQDRMAQDAVAEATGAEPSTEEDEAEKLIVEFARGAMVGIGLLAFAAAFFFLGAAWRGSQMVGGVS